MKKVREILNHRDGELISLQSDELVYDALKIMARFDIGSVVILDGERFAGIVTERDCVRKVTIQGRSPFKTHLLTIMTTDTPSVSPESSLSDCMEIMTRYRCRHLPVFEGPKFISVVSIGDMVHALMYEKDEVIDQMNQYIHDLHGAC